MRSGAEDPHLVDVELVEGDPPVRPEAGAAAPAARPPARGRHVRAWLAAGTLAAVALVTAVVNQAEARRDETRLAALADLPGFLDPLTEPLSVAWRGPAGTPVARTDLAVLTTHEGTRTLRALALVDGRLLWERPVARGEACRPLAGPGDGDPDMPLVSRVVCLPSTGRGLPAPGAVTVVDATTGERVREAHADGLMFADVADGRVLLTSAEPDGAVLVRAWDPVTGGDAWAFRSAPGLLAAVEAEGGGRYALRDGVLRVGNRDRGFALATATGDRLDEAPADAGRAVVALPDGGEARWVHDRFGRPTDVTVHGRDGDQRFAVPGVPWLAAVTDGSAPDVLVVRRTSDQHLLGLDATTGRVRWDLANVPWLGPSAQVSGVVVGVGPSSAVALDLGTGLRLWDADATRSVRGWQALTDGRLVLLPQEDATGRLRVSALRLRTGDTAWEVPLPDGVLALQQVGGRTIVAVTEAGLVALR